MVNVDRLNILHFLFTDKKQVVSKKQSVIKTTSELKAMEEEKEITTSSDYGSETDSVNGDPLSPKSPKSLTSSLSMNYERRENFSVSPISPIKSTNVFNTTAKYSNVNEIPLSGRMFDHTNPAEIKPFVCVSCNCGFGEISSIRAHVRHSHLKNGITNELFSCAYCCDTFRDLDGLKYHFEICKRKSSPTSPPVLTKRSPFTYTYETSSHKPLKRSSSEDFLAPAAKRNPTSFYSPTSPGGLSTSSDTTQDRVLSYRKPYYYTECPPGCNCGQQKPFKKSVLKETPRFESDYVQNRYLIYLEQYQRMLESHVNLMEAIKVYKN
jgi:hypothetical protein